MKAYFFVVIENFKNEKFVHNMEHEAENRKALLDWVYSKFGESIETIHILSEEDADEKKDPSKFNKKLVIDLAIEAYSSFGLKGEELVKAVEKDICHSIQERLYVMEGDVGCANDGKSFGYKFKPTGFRLE